MTRDETQKLEVGSRIFNGSRKGVVAQHANNWFMVHWHDTDIPTIFRRDAAQDIYSENQCMGLAK